MKSTVEEIRRRFDGEVERFANLETGQVATVDARLSLELITEAAARLAPDARRLLDVGCGAGNYTLMMLQKLPALSCALLDLSGPMLERAAARVLQQTNRAAEVFQGDVREVALRENHFDIILAGAVLHHLRDDADWEGVFGKLYRLLRPGGCLLIADLVAQDEAALTELVWQRYAGYLEGRGGAEYCRKVLDYIAREDSPRSVTYQLELMSRVGFGRVEILHKNMCFAAFGGVKARPAEGGR
ncbi:MAG: class I SAM-dependent methyltransferase [Verrucomicrobiales bacterium]|jgi:tRNA (cmo5U34)-methyltransferase|nr:class I SAM-dependent methyltransferase [Verrucomicrobiales bacterium]